MKLNKFDDQLEMSRFEKFIYVSVQPGFKFEIPIDNFHPILYANIFAFNPKLFAKTSEVTWIWRFCEQIETDFGSGTWVQIPL